MTGKIDKAHLNWFKRNKVIISLILHSTLFAESILWQRGPQKNISGMTGNACRDQTDHAVLS